MPRNDDLRASYDYMLCGWRARSEVPLTSVPVAACGNGSSIDIRIQLAVGHSPIRETMSSVFEHSAKRSLIRIYGVADFEISDGCNIRVWPAADATQKDVEIFLCGPAWATLCHQRGMLPLHASGIVVGEGIAAFAGHSGAGKSTTAATLSALDYELVADDILPISLNQDSLPGAAPFLRRLKLKGETISELGFMPTESVSERLDKEKQFVYPKLAADDTWRTLERLYLLEVDPTEPRTSIEQLTGADAVRALVDQTYHFSFILNAGSFRDHLALCAQIASKIPVYRLRRPLRGAKKEFASVISAHLEKPKGARCP